MKNFLFRLRKKFIFLLIHKQLKQITMNYSFSFVQKKQDVFTIFIPIKSTSPSKKYFWKQLDRDTEKMLRFWNTVINKTVLDWFHDSGK